MQLQLGTPLHAGGRSVHEGDPLPAPAIPVQKALQYWLEPHVVSPQLTPDELPPLPDPPPADVPPPPAVAPAMPPRARAGRSAATRCSRRRAAAALCMLESNLTSDLLALRAARAIPVLRVDALKAQRT